MKEEKLKELLERYFCGETTVDEERGLKEYFAGNNIIPGYEAEKKMFSGYQSASDNITEPSKDLESRVMRSIDEFERKNRKAGITVRFLTFSGIAAAFLILIASWFFFLRSTEPEDTYKDPAIAYAETVKVLNEVSLKLNKGTSAFLQIDRLNSVARKSIETIDKSASLINGSIEKIRLLGRFPEPDLQTKYDNK